MKWPIENGTFHYIPLQPVQQALQQLEEEQAAAVSSEDVVAQEEDAVARLLYKRMALAKIARNFSYVPMCIDAMETSMVLSSSNVHRGSGGGGGGGGDDGGSGG